jgi:mycothiol synthase
MENDAIHPAPPNLAGLAWRPLLREDLAALVDLAGACLRADGGLPFLFEPDILQDTYFPTAPGAALGAYASDGRLVACAAVHAGGGAGAPRATIVGQVRPDLRNRGIGGYLMRWSREQARSLLAGAAESQPVLQVHTESLTGPAERLYLAHGFEKVFEELVMRLDLDRPLPDRPLPGSVAITSWEPKLGEQFYQAYHTAFRERPGFPGWSAVEWIERVTENDFKPEWSLLACAGGAPAGFVIGNIDLTTRPPGGFVWQIGVIPAQRRRGIASALLVETLRRMQVDGIVFAQLTVHTNNPGAIQAYERLGFTTIGRRARFERAGEQTFASWISCCRG